MAKKVGGKLADKGWLCTQYVDRGRSLGDIARELGASPESVRYRLLSFGVTMRARKTTNCRIDKDGRECTKCGQYKPWSQFWGSATGHGHANHRMSRCILCIDKESARAVMHAYKLRRHHITEEQIAYLITLDGDVCALCGGSQQIEGADLDIDHDHKCCPGAFSCGKCIRGRLCRACNRLAGRVEAANFTLAQLAEYLVRRPLA